MIAWRLVARWSNANLDYGSLSAGERWSVVAATMKALLRTGILRPARLWLLAHTPAWLVAGRLQRRSYSWFRISGASAAEHVRLRFNIWPIEVGDHVRLKNGRLTAVGYATPTFTEIIFVLPNGELEPDPRSPEMARAWGKYAMTRFPHPSI